MTREQCGITSSVDVNIIVDNRVRVEIASLGASAIDRLKTTFEYPNPEYQQKKSLKLPGWWAVPKVITTWQSAGSNDLTFPRGGFARITSILEGEGYDYFVTDNRQRGTALSDPLEHSVTLYDHQREVVDAALEREQCLIRAPTGSGKTTALLAIAARVGVPTLVMVHSKGLYDQWFDRAKRELGMQASEIGVLQGSKRKVRPFTIAIQKTLANIVTEPAPDITDYFGCVIADECHLTAARTAYAAIDPFPARYRIGASADHRRKDRKEFLIHDLFGDVAADIDRKRLIEAGLILDVQVRLIPTEFRADWYGLPDESDESKKLNFVRLVQEMAADPERNRLIVTCIRNALGDNEQVLVMGHEREHCHTIAPILVGDGASVGYLIGGADYAIEFRSTIAGLKSGVTRVGIGTYQAVGTGIDLPRVGVGVAMTPIAANEQLFNQVRGRVCRTATGKTSARLYMLWDRHVYPRHLNNLCRWNANTVVLDGKSWVNGKDYQRLM